MEAWYKSEKVQKRHHLEVSELVPPLDVKEFDRFCQGLNNWSLITKDYTLQNEQKKLAHSDYISHAIQPKHVKIL